MNLQDVVTLTPKKKVSIPAPLLTDFKAEREATRSAISMLSSAYMKSPDGKNTNFEALIAAANLLTKVSNTSASTLVQNVFLEQNGMPDLTEILSLSVTQMRDGSLSTNESQSQFREFGKLKQFSESPRMSMEDVREISSIANMILVPFDYLNPKSFSSENYNHSYLIKSFAAEASSLGMTPYVIAPLRHYSILHQLNAKDPDLNIVGNAFQPSFEVISMMMPALLMQSDRLTAAESDINLLYKKADSMDTQMKNVVRGLESMEKRMNALYAKVEQQQKELLEQKIALEEIQREQAAARERKDSWFMINDPMLFAVPRGQTIDTASSVFVGPAWGPDFPEITAAALSLKLKKGQRAKMKEAISNIWNR